MIDNELFDLKHKVFLATGWLPEKLSVEYLLEKLPWSTVCSGPNEGMFGAWMNGQPKETFNEADTPLKALLKLVIALDDAGVKL